MTIAGFISDYCDYIEIIPLEIIPLEIILARNHTSSTSFFELGQESLVSNEVLLSPLKQLLVVPKILETYSIITLSHIGHFL